VLFLCTPSSTSWKLDDAQKRQSLPASITQEPKQNLYSSGQRAADNTTVLFKSIRISPILKGASQNISRNYLTSITMFLGYSTFADPTNAFFILWNNKNSLVGCAIWGFEKHSLDLAFGTDMLLKLQLSCCLYYSIFWYRFKREESHSANCWELEVINQSINQSCSCYISLNKFAYNRPIHCKNQLVETTQIFGLFYL